MPSWLSILPDDVSCLIWKQVYDGVLVQLQHVALDVYQSRCDDFLFIEHGNVCVAGWVLVKMALEGDEVCLFMKSSVSYFYSNFDIGILPAVDPECRMELALGQRRRQTLLNISTKNDLQAM